MSKIKKYVNSFKEYLAIFEDDTRRGKEKVRGIRVFPPGTSYKLDTNAKGEGGRIQWTGVREHFPKWMNAGEHLSVSVDIEHGYDRWNYDELNVNPKYRSKFLGTWHDKDLPLFSEDHPAPERNEEGKEKSDFETRWKMHLNRSRNSKFYDVVEFDVVGLVKQENGNDEMFKYNGVKIDFVKVKDKNGNEFVIPPWMILDVQRGNSICDGVLSGTVYLIDSMRARIANYKNNIVYFKMQDGTEKTMKLSEFKGKRLTKIDDV